MIWSSGSDKMFESRLSNSGFKVHALPVRKHATAKSTSYMIYIADKTCAAGAEGGSGNGAAG